MEINQITNGEIQEAEMFTPADCVCFQHTDPVPHCGVIVSLQHKLPRESAVATGNAAGISGTSPTS